MTIKIPAIIKINRAKNPQPLPKWSNHVINWSWTPTMLKTMERNPRMNIEKPMAVTQPFFCMFKCFMASDKIGITVRKIRLSRKF